MPIRAIASIWYPVSDWTRAKRFYVDTLGLRLEFCNDDAGWAGCRTAAGGPPIFLIRKEATTGTSGGGGAVVSFDVDDVDGLKQSIVAAGGTLSPDLQEGPEVRIHTVYDPDGNALELCEAVAPTTAGAAS